MDTHLNWRKPFFTIYLGQGFSILSSSAVQFSIIWWITTTTGSAMALTFASIAGLLPQAVIGPFAGVWIDRMDRKKIIIFSDAAIATSSLLLAILFVLGFQSLELVYMILFIRALGETFHKPAMQALIPQIVPANDLTKAGGFGQMISSASTMIGPMLGALIMSIMSLPYALLIDVLGAAFAVITLSMVKTNPLVGNTNPLVNNTNPLGDNTNQHMSPRAKTSVIEDMKQGFKAIQSNKVLLRLSIPMLISTIIFIPLGTMLPLMVKDYFNGTAWHNSIVQTLYSFGMLTASMVIGVTGGLKRQFLMISLSIGLLGICAFTGGILPPNLFWVFCILVFIMGTTGMGFNIPFTAYIQKSVPAENLGKVISLVTSVMSFAAPVGMFIAGPVSEIIGVSNWMILAGVIMIFVGLLNYFLTRAFDQPLE